MPYIPERKPEEPAQVPVKQSGEDKQSSPKTVFRRMRPALVCLFAIAVVYGAVRLAGYGLEYAGSRETGRELQALYRETETVPETQTMPPENTAAPAAAAVAAKLPETTAAGKTENDVLEAVPYPDNPNMTVPERFRQRVRAQSIFLFPAASSREVRVRKSSRFPVDISGEVRARESGRRLADITGAAPVPKSPWSLAAASMSDRFSLPPTLWKTTAANARLVISRRA